MIARTIQNFHNPEWCFSQEGYPSLIPFDAIAVLAEIRKEFRPGVSFIQDKDITDFKGAGLEGIVTPEAIDTPEKFQQKVFDALAQCLNGVLEDITDLPGKHAVSLEAGIMTGEEVFVYSSDKPQPGSVRVFARIMKANKLTPGELSQKFTSWSFKEGQLQPA